MTCEQVSLHYSGALENLKKLIAAESSNEAFVYADSLVTELEKISAENCPKAFWIRYYKGESLEFKMNFEQALELYYELIRDAEKVQDWEMVAQCYISIARCHEAIGRKKDCLRNLELAKKYIHTYKLEVVVPVFAMRYSSYHRIYGNKDTAIVYAKMAIEKGKKLGILRPQYDGYLLLGMLYDDVTISNDYFRQAARVFLKNKSFIGAGYMYINMVNKLWKANMLKEAKLTCDTAQTFANLIKKLDLDYYRINYRIFEFKRKYFEKINLIDSAYYYQKLSVEFEKKSENIVNTKKIEEASIEFAIEKEKEKLVHAEKINSISMFALSGMGFLLLMILLAWYINVKKQKLISAQNQLISQNNEALKQSVQRQGVLLSEIHHRVKNNLQVVLSLIELEGIKSGEKHVRLLFDDIARKVKSIALIHDQLYRTGDLEKINVNIYFQDLLVYFQALLPENEKFIFEITSDDVHLNIETVLPLGIICSELIGNSIKYGKLENQKLKLNISLTLVNEKYFMTYKDNGPGISEDNNNQITSKMGFNIITNMVRQLHAESTRYNQNGAVFTMSFKEKVVSSI